MTASDLARIPQSPLYFRTIAASHASSGTFPQAMAFATTSLAPALRRAANTAASTRRHARAARPRHGARMTAAEAAPATAGGLEAAWATFAAEMRRSGQSPPLEQWHTLLDTCLAAGEAPSKAIWVVDTMRSTGVAPTALSYQKVLQVCAAAQDRAAAFHLVELMFKDGVLLGDVDLPDGMEEVLRTILPPEAFD